MNDLQIFNNPHFGEVRTITEDGKTLFCGNDVATALGYKRPKDAIAAHCKGAVIRRLLTNGGEQDMKFIPEGDIYRLAARSELPGADDFERWIFDEVLPRIRKEGGYIAGVSSSEELLAKALLAAQRALEGQTARIAELEAENVGLMAGSARDINPWNDEEFQRLLTCALTAGREDYITILYLARFAGLSLDECFSIDMKTAEKAAKEKALTVRGENGQERVIPLCQLVYQRIGWMVCRTQDRLFVLRSQTAKEAKDAFQKFFEYYSKLVRFDTSPQPLTFDSLRHTYAAEKYQDFITTGKTPYEARKAVSKLLGHGRDDVTNIYLASLKEGKENG